MTADHFFSNAHYLDPGTDADDDMHVNDNNTNSTPLTALMPGPWPAQNARHTLKWISIKIGRRGVWMYGGSVCVL